MQTDTTQPLVAALWQLQRTQSGTKDKWTRKIFQGLACRRQVIYLLSAFLIAVPNLASSTNYDLRADWSDAGLPMAGVWTIDFDGTPMIPVPNVEVTGADGFLGGQPGYTTVANDLVPIWFQARDDAINYFGNPPDADWLLGDIVFHDADAAPTSASWTSPENGLADISISLWNPRNFGRIQHFELTINGMVLGFGDVDDTSDRANRVSLSVNNVPVSVGDVVAVTSTSIVVEDYMGLDFSIVTTSIDTDGDGVDDNDDVCDGTVIPESLPTMSLGVNRFALVDGDGEFDTTPPNGEGPNRSYSTADTAGCSCTQIIDAQGLGEGHTRHGCSISAMDDWVELVTP